MNDLLKEMEADFEANIASNVEKLDQGELGSVASIARQIRDKEITVSDLEAKLKREKKELLKLTDEDLPTVFAEMGLSELTLDDVENGDSFPMEMFGAWVGHRATITRSK